MNNNILKEKINALPREAGHVYFLIQPEHTNYINRIIEGYEYLGVMSTVDKDLGIAVVRSTEDTECLTRQVLQSLPEVLEIF